MTILRSVSASRKFGGVALPTVRRAVVAACLIFAGAVVGNLLQWLVPAHDLADAKGVITTVHGVVSALLAIVLGLVIWTSYGVFTQQQSEAATLGSQLLQFDVLLERLGPDGARGRELMRRELIVARKRFWGGGGRASPGGPRPETRTREGS